jgi:uncharacterized protein (DUF2147 family)
MKKYLFIAFALFFGIKSMAQSKGNFTESDKIEGIWMIQDKDAKIKIYRAVNGKYYGKIVWLKFPTDANGNPVKDSFNPDPKLKTRDKMGITILKDFVYDAEDKEYVDGTVYSSKDGNTYSGYMYLIDKDHLFMKGYILGMRFLGKENTWTRVE